MANEHDDSLCECPWHRKQRALIFGHDEVAAHLNDWPDERPDDN